MSCFRFPRSFTSLENYELGRMNYENPLLVCPFYLTAVPLDARTINSGVSKICWFSGERPLIKSINIAQVRRPIS